MICRTCEKLNRESDKARVVVLPTYFKRNSEGRRIENIYEVRAGNRERDTDCRRVNQVPLCVRPLLLLRQTPRSHCTVMGGVVLYHLLLLFPIEAINQSPAAQSHIHAPVCDSTHTCLLRMTTTHTTTTAAAANDNNTNNDGNFLPNQ